MDKVKKIVKREFGKPRKMYLATSYLNHPKVKIINTYYLDGNFYYIEDNSSSTMEHILHNPIVSLCSSASFHKFQGKASEVEISALSEEVLGLLQEKLPNWNKISDATSSKTHKLIRVQVCKGFTYAGKIGYSFNFDTNMIDTQQMRPNM